MAKEKIEEESPPQQVDKEQLSAELNTLLEAFIPYQSITGLAIIQLNSNRTLLNLGWGDEIATDVENDGTFIDTETYNKVRTALQNKRNIPENKWDENFKSAKKQIIDWCVKKGTLDDKEGFLNEFQQFIEKLPEVPVDFIDSCRELKELNIDDWDIDDTKDDPRFDTLQDIHKKMLSSFESYKSLGEDYIERKNQTQEGEQNDLIPLEKKYPKQTAKVKRIFAILNYLERCKALDDQIDKIAFNLGLPSKSVEKLKGYFNASEATDPEHIVNYPENHWYTDEDMNTYGRVLEKYGVDLNTQFSNRLTLAGIKTLPPKQSIRDNHPRYICFNLSCSLMLSFLPQVQGAHWVAIVLLKQTEKVTVFYKDSKGDWNHSSEAVQHLFNEHYNGVDFIKHPRAEQVDNSSCGPMALNNLEIMARTIKEATDEGKDVVEELISLFKKPGDVFTTQDQVGDVRINHLLLKKPRGNKTDVSATVDNLQTIIKKLQTDTDKELIDGHFDIHKIKKDGNSFYEAIADQLERLKVTYAIRDQPDVINHEYLRALALDHVKNNRERFGKDIGPTQKTDSNGSNTLEEYIELHSKGGAPDSGMMRALAEALGITVKIYNQDRSVDVYNTDGDYSDEENTDGDNTDEDYSDGDYVFVSSDEDNTDSQNRDAYNTGACKAAAYNTDVNTDACNTFGEKTDAYNTGACNAAACNTGVPKIVNLQCIDNHYNSLIHVEDDNKKKLESHIHTISEYYEQVKDWGLKELRSWSTLHKGKLDKNFNNDAEAKKICEAVAVIDRANEIATGGHRLHNTQKVAILIFIQTNTKGHISQINTGEGKTTIISVVSALKVLQGYKCHVITSNNVLAADGVKDKTLFYSLLNISVANNNPVDKYTDGPRSCYSQDVVYGSITSFQFDWLRDSFEKLRTLGGIDYQNIWVMLDEIDSLLIDQGSNIAKLSGPFPGMESLRYVYINIWVALAKAEERVTEEIVKQLKQKADELNRSEDNDEEKQKIYEELEDSLRESFLDEVKVEVKKSKDDLINRKILAAHLHEYAEDSLERWIDCAFTAKYQYTKNVEYKIIKKDKEDIIIPVDNQNTGVSMKNTILSNGLHQFLQIKHNLCLTYESLTSCYVSNLDYIKKYGSKLSGATGTLGSLPERNLLGQVFYLGFSVIPPCKPKQFIQFPGKVCSDEQFVNDVAIAALGEITRTQKTFQYHEDHVEELDIKVPRATLIVCASILDVEIISEEIAKEAKDSGLSPRIFKYIDESDVHITENTLSPGDIVIATNLAGRGTDFRTTPTLESNGGLHVIVAFLPCNKRVEDQGFGRTSRQGNKGTGQIIIRNSEVETLGLQYDTNFPEIISRRDELETLRVDDIAANKITELEFKGQLFDKFSSEYGRLKEEHKTGPDVLKWKYVLRDLKEKWAFWLEKQNYTCENIKTIITKQKSYIEFKKNYLEKAVEQEFQKFLKEATPILNGIINHNPYYSICLSEKYLDMCTDKTNREKAKSELTHAIRISNSSDLLYSAYIKLFEIAIEDGGQVLKRYKKAVAKIFFFPLEDGCPDYKRNALDNLQKASVAIAIEHDYLQELIEGKQGAQNEGSEGEKGPQEEVSCLASIVVDQNEDEGTNLFVKHLQSRLVCLAAYKGNIESVMKQLRGEEKNLEKPEDTIGPDDGVIIDAKVPKYLSKLDPENDLKKYVTDRSVDELEYVGMSSVYQVRKIHDVHIEVIRGAQIQIGGGFALLVTAAAFPLLLPVNGPIASAMISEGITDIITALIQQGQSGFNKIDYIKGKVISYGITLATMGLSAIMSSTKILNKAVNACKNLATKLRAVKGPFAGICRFLANHLDRLAIYLETVIEKIEFARKTAAEQAKYLTKLKDANKLQQFQQLQKSLKVSDIVLSHSQKITQIVTSSVLGAVKGVIISVAIERVVIASLNNLMSALQPMIKEKVRDAVKTKILEENRRGTFENVSETTINEAIAKLFTTTLEEDIKDVGKEIGLGIMRHSSNWKVQLVTLASESILSGIDIATCTNKVCNKFIYKLSSDACNTTKFFDKNKLIEADACNTTKNADKSKLIEAVITQISDQVSSMIYTKIVTITGKVVVTLPKALYRGYKEHKEKEADKKDISDMEKKIKKIDAADDAATANNSKCVHDAVSETLGMDENKGSKQLADATNLGASTEGATIEDTKKLYLQNGIDVVHCQEENALTQFQKQDSDRGVICLSGKEVQPHAIPVMVEGGSLMVKDGGETISLDKYKEKYRYTNAEFVIPKNVNSSTLPQVQHRCNLNRIVRATHSIDYVGQGEGRKFGAVGAYFIADSKNPNDIGKMVGYPKTIRALINLVENNPLCEGAAVAHSITKHVGRVEGKTSFKNKDMLCEKYEEATRIMRSKKDADKQKVTITTGTMPGGNGERKIITVRVKNFYGYDDRRDSAEFRYITMVMDKPEGRDRFLPQTVFPRYNRN